MAEKKNGHGGRSVKATSECSPSQVESERSFSMLLYQSKILEDLYATGWRMPPPKANDPVDRGLHS